MPTKKRIPEKPVSPPTERRRARSLKPFAIQENRDGTFQRVPLHEVDLDAAAFVLVGTEEMKPRSLMRHSQ